MTVAIPARSVPAACTPTRRHARILRFPIHPDLPMSIQRWAPLALVLVAGAVASPVASAQANVEVSAGVSTTTDREFTQVVAAAWLPALRTLDRAVLRAEVGALYFDGRDDVSGRNLSDDVVVGHVGLRYERTDNGLTLGAGVGAQHGETDALSGDPQFVTTLGWRFERASVFLRHVSNASLHEPNDGETMLMAAWRF
jgi:hypothetical protein